MESPLQFFAGIKDPRVERTKDHLLIDISSLQADAQQLNRCIRSHWKIENSLHWILDVAFHEDQSRKRAGNAAENFSVINRIALNLLKNELTTKQGIKGKRLKAGWSNDYLEKVLSI